MTTGQWFHDEDFDFDTRLPDDVSEEVKRIYGAGPIGKDFAQGLASFLAITGWSFGPVAEDK